MLGGEDWIRTPDDSNQRDDIVFVGDARENLGDLEFSLVLTTRRLLPNQYPEASRALADRVRAMRHERAMTFQAIASELNNEGVRGARGARLSAESVFSIYKKRQSRIARNCAPSRYKISSMKVYPLSSGKTHNKT